MYHSFFNDWLRTVFVFFGYYTHLFTIQCMDTGCTIHFLMTGFKPFLIFLVIIPTYSPYNVWIQVSQLPGISTGISMTLGIICLIR